jgi:hypothetical protein
VMPAALAGGSPVGCPVASTLDQELLTNVLF